MALELETSLDACTTFQSTLSKNDTPDSRRNKIWRHFMEINDKPGSIGDFEVGLEWFNCGVPLSLGRQLRGKIVILDFFTYCCINCLHILPLLRQLEDRFTPEKGVVVVGVHSAKFDNEKDSANIAAALKRYNVSHPVVNDSEGVLWKKLGISCWPTLLILGPLGQPLFQLVGEGHEIELFEFVSAAVDFYGSLKELTPDPIPVSTSDSVLKGPLLFPGKVTSTLKEDGSEIIAIANSGLHTVIIATAEGTIQHVIGRSGQPGFVDGDFNTAAFNSPHGLAFSSCDSLFVADTENHAIRKVDLKKRCVLTIVGNGQQGSDISGGGVGAAQSLSSPWDLCLYQHKVVPLISSFVHPFLCICPAAPPGYRNIYGATEAESSTSDTPLTNAFPTPVPPSAPPVGPPPPPPPPIQSSASPRLPVPLVGHPPPPAAPPSAPMSPIHPMQPLPPLPGAHLGSGTGEPVEQDILLIAMAGSHQIWALFFHDTVLWGKEFFAAGTCANIAGSGNEACRNNSYPRSASFAQPSGVAYCFERDELLIADSESSSVRCINMKTGKVSSVVGGSKIPDDLFSFGDVDGSGYNAKLQHPLGVAWHNKSRSLYVADSYNHKIKMINLETVTCTSYIGNGHAGNVLAGLKSQLSEPGGLSISVDQSKLYIADTNNHSIKVLNFTSSSIIELNLHNQVPATSEKNDKPTKATPLRVSLNGKVTLNIDTLLPSGLKLTDGAPQRWILKLPDSDWKADALSGIYNPHKTLTVSVIAAATGLVQLSTKLFLCAEGACKAVSTTLAFSIICDINAPQEVVHETVFHFD